MEAVGVEDVLSFASHDLVEGKEHVLANGALVLVKVLRDVQVRRLEQTHAHCLSPRKLHLCVANDRKLRQRVLHIGLVHLDGTRAPRLVQTQHPGEEQNDSEDVKHVKVPVNENDQTAAPQRQVLTVVCGFACVARCAVKDEVSVNVEADLWNHHNQHEHEVQLRLRHAWVFESAPKHNQRDFAQDFDSLNVRTAHNEH
jgi:hypothetical protein